MIKIILRYKLLLRKGTKVQRKRVIYRYIYKGKRKDKEGTSIHKFLVKMKKGIEKQLHKICSSSVLFFAKISVTCILLANY